ncbi:MAG: DUF938 domain-containing protein [Gammaproteobacteria bacterium]|nr:DUF938 domain-containing protein [Gammaproteobacteria bacterium]MDE0480029.1 DUF938 domain-containing protein [Gammaproteobacteria bacterium]
MDALPYSQACENNKRPILSVLQWHLDGVRSLLEIGAGTGQHAEFLAGHFPELRWQASDTAASLPLLRPRIERAGLPEPVALDIDAADWGCGSFDAIFSANVLHIVGAPSVENFFRGLGPHLNPDGLLLVYGPFRYRNAYTSESNAQFDRWLKQRDPVSGIRDFEWVDALAQDAGLSLAEDNAMPANNQLLVFRMKSDGFNRAGQPADR